MEQANFWLQLALGVLGPAGASAVAVKVVLNGTKERVKDIASDVKEVNEEVKKLRDVYHDQGARIFILEQSRDGGRRAGDRPDECNP